PLPSAVDSHLVRHPREDALWRNHAQKLHDQNVLSRVFFFFSSRRRHTRSKRDWSSDVCSSDLPGLPATTDKRIRSLRSLWTSCRSEERRVGKECRSRWLPCDYRKKYGRSSGYAGRSWERSHCQRSWHLWRTRGAAGVRLQCGRD